MWQIIAADTERSKPQTVGKEGIFGMLSCEILEQILAVDSWFKAARVRKVPKAKSFIVSQTKDNFFSMQI